MPQLLSMLTWLLALAPVLLAPVSLAQVIPAQVIPAQQATEGTPPLHEIADLVQKRYQRTQSLRAEFRQEAYNKALGRTRKASGHVVIVKPGKMRWEYTQPDKRLIVSDGATLWLYFPASNQVMIEAAAGQDDFVRAFLSGEGRLRQDFEIEAVEDSSLMQADEYGLQLRPKVPHTNVTRMLLFVDRQGLLVKRVTTYDILGNSTTLFLSNLEVNGAIEAGTFTFQPPAGVEIVTPPSAPRPGR